MKFITLMLLSLSLYAQYPDINVRESNPCEALKDSLYDENWVMLHHIDYGHVEETKSSIKKLRVIVKQYDKQCSNAKSEYSHADMKDMLQKLDKTEKTFMLSPLFGIKNRP